MDWKEIYSDIKWYAYSVLDVVLNPLLRPLGCQVVPRSYYRFIHKVYMEHRTECPFRAISAGKVKTDED
ncbi:MAG TPA: hypothetical protein VKX46_09325 [Ktedonobacteraceae bacterium]|jgi:hypothetical protein|nr:hypothetical protein [Ktedonobacteraceae bacterium]